MTEPVFRDAVVSSSHHLHLSGCPVVTYEYVGHLMFSFHIELCTFLGINISFLIELLVWSSLVICSPLFIEMCHCNTV